MMTSSRAMNVLSVIFIIDNVSVNCNCIHSAPGNPWEIFFGNFLSNSLPEAKNHGRIPGGGAKFSQMKISFVIEINFCP